MRVKVDNFFSLIHSFCKRVRVFLFSRTHTTWSTLAGQGAHATIRTMIRLSAQIDADLAAIAGKQLPFAASLAINRTAIGARDLVRGNLPKRFRLRNNWTRGGIQARMGSKGSLVAHVLAPDYMRIQETGGERRPTRSKMLAAPAEEFKGNRVLRKAERPRALLSQGRVFIIGMPGGDAGVFERTGPKRQQIRLLYWLSDQHDYDQRFEFEADVREHVSDRFSTNFAAAVAQALG